MAIQTKNAPDISPPNLSPADDPRVAAFCSPRHPELFHAFAYSTDIWKRDPFDVESIHQNARDKFQRIVGRVLEPSGLATGRILLLLGESGCGKTHLMRAFRNQVHSRSLGYCGYLQMTAFTDQYGRYVLNNLIDSLDKPYDGAESKTTGLMRLSSALAEWSPNFPREQLSQLREGGLDQASIDNIIYELAGAIIVDERFSNINEDLVKALLYLQCNNPLIKGPVLKYLRCEDLTVQDRRLLGGLAPYTYPDAPQRLIQRLGELMWVVEKVPMILCVDQLEDVFDLDEAPIKFRRAMATLCDIVSRLPSAIVVIACLDDFYQKLKEFLTRSIADRVENDPAPVGLKAPSERDEVEGLIGQRLKFLYESLDIPFQRDQPTYPLPPALVRKMVGQRARDVLGEVHRYRERCIERGKMAEYPIEGIGPVDQRSREAEIILLEQAWNEFRSTFSPVVPVDEMELTSVLAEAIRSCSDEMESGEHFEADAAGRMAEIECHAVDQSVERILVGVCNKSPQGGWLGRQIEEVVKQAGEHTPVIVRSTDYPSNPKAAVVQQLGQLIKDGGRTVVVQDSDWRAMMALLHFRKPREAAPNFAAWLKQTRPLTSLNSLRAILDLDYRAQPTEISTPTPKPDPPPPPVISPPPRPAESLVVGTTADRRGGPVTIEPGDLTRHAAFLGASGSGKTTAALSIVEQLLLHGIPAILIDRKGDLCSYARPDMGLREGLEGELAERADRLRASVDVALFTPGRPDGRTLSIAAVPAGLGLLSSLDREQAAKFAAAALAGMMNYGDGQRDQSCLAILKKAIELLSQEDPQAAVSIEALIAFVAEKDTSLVNAVGRLDVKLFEKLADHLETLRINREALLTAQGEPLDIDMLLGLGLNQTPGKTRLSMISTKFLGNNQDVQFWVAQFLMTLGRWISRSPATSGSPQAVVLFDEADLYLPAVRQPATKEPMQNLLRRARSAGVGLLLATQSPGDFDYKCRDNIRTWFVGQIREVNSIAKMKPMLSECRIDVASRLPGQEPGEFLLIRDGDAVSLKARLSVVDARQIPEDEIVALARATRGR
jgi:energy-coupling factor transporter ATP-binding protein EcfA2